MDDFTATITEEEMLKYGKDFQIATLELEHSVQSITGDCTTHRREIWRREGSKWHLQEMKVQRY